MAVGVPTFKTKTRRHSSDIVASELGLSVQQYKALAALSVGKSIKQASKDAGTTRDTVLRWMSDHEAFRKEFAKVSAQARKALVSQIVTASETATDKLHKLAQSPNKMLALAASKSLLTAGVTLVKSTADAQEGVSSAPIFVIAQGTAVSLESEIPAVPETPAAVVVDDSTKSI